LVSNWIAAPGWFNPPCGLSNVCFWMYCCRLRSASPSDPLGRRCGVVCVCGIRKPSSAGGTTRASCVSGCGWSVGWFRF
jgi:hypothetical protein